MILGDGRCLLFIDDTVQSGVPLEVGLGHIVRVVVLGSGVSHGHGLGFFIRTFLRLGVASRRADRLSVDPFFQLLACLFDGTLGNGHALLLIKHGCDRNVGRGSSEGHNLLLRIDQLLLDLLTDFRLEVYLNSLAVVLDLLEVPLSFLLADFGLG